MRILLLAVCYCLSLTLGPAADRSDVKIPNAWRKMPSGEQAPGDGDSWSRTFVNVPTEWADTDLTLYLVERATNNPSIHVRKQLAASAQRLPAVQALPIIRALIEQDADASDIHQPLMIRLSCCAQLKQSSSGPVQ